MGRMYGDFAMNTEHSALYEDTIVQLYIYLNRFKTRTIWSDESAFLKKLKWNSCGRRCFHHLFPSWRPIDAKRFEQFFWLNIIRHTVWSALALARLNRIFLRTGGHGHFRAMTAFKFCLWRALSKRGPLFKVEIVLVFSIKCIYAEKLHTKGWSKRIVAC